MKCPKCNFSKSLVLDSRPREDDSAKIRKRRCQSCDFIYHTVEIFYNKPVREKVSKPKVDNKQAKKSQMNKRLAKIKRRETAKRIDMMTDDELEEAMFSGADLRELGLD